MSHWSVLISSCALGIALSSHSTLRAQENAPAGSIRLTESGEFKQRPHWSPDGNQVAFSRHRKSTIEVVLLNIDSNELKRLTDRTEPEFDAVFSPDGKQLLFVLDKTSGTQGDMQIYRTVLGTSELHPVAVTSTKLSHEESPAWSPDGRRLAFTSTRDGNQELYVADVPNSDKPATDWHRLTSHPGIDAHPCWTPDGQWIVFATARWGDLELARIPAVGGPIERLTDSPGLDDYPAVSPDGRSIAFTSSRQGSLDILLLKLQTGTVTVVTSGESIENFPAWHPDGTLTFVSNHDGQFDLYRTRLSHSKPKSSVRASFLRPRSEQLRLR